MEKSKGFIYFIVILAVIALVQGSFFIVDQTQSALILQLGKPVRDVMKPGLNFKLPFVQNVIFFDKRVLEYDSAPAEILTEDKKNLVVDNYAKWKIIEPLKFYQTVKNYYGAQSRLDDIIYSELRVVLGKHTLQEIVSLKRSEIMSLITKKCNEISHKYGIEILDVRIKRADLPPENERHVYDRMKAERKRQAKKYREKIKDRKHQLTEETVEKNESPAITERQIVKTDNYVVKPLTVEEAALQLDALENEFIVFRNIILGDIFINSYIIFN